MPRRNSELTEMTRSQLATVTNCGMGSIRYYEDIGLMPEPHRAANGYRIYNEESRKRLSFILRLRGLGFSIGNTKNVCDLLDDDAYTPRDVYEIMMTHLEVIRAKINELRRMERRLKGLVSQCGRGKLPTCPIIDALYA